MPVENILEHHRLSPAERRVLAQLAWGESNAEIAEAVGVSPDTVRSTLHRFSNRTDLAGRRVAAWAAWHYACCVVGSG